MVMRMNNKVIFRYWMFNARWYLLMFLLYGALLAMLTEVGMIMLCTCVAGICCTATSLFYPMGSKKAKICLLTVPVSRKNIWRTYFTGVTVLEVVLLLVGGLLAYYLRRDAEMFALVCIAALGSHTLLSRVPHSAMAFLLAILPALLVIIPRLMFPGVFGGVMGWTIVRVLLIVDVVAWYRERKFFVNAQDACRPERNSLC